MVHMGGAGLPALNRSAVEMAQQHANIILIGSSIGDRSVLDALQALGSARVCYGSDAPFHLMHVCLAMYQALLRDFSAADRANVMGGNIARLLGVAG
jgi:predicted TIM-barrel fold metal-dependent hydrolase